MPKSSAPMIDQIRPAARQHGDDDGDEPGAAGDEGHEGPGRHDRQVGAADAGQRAGDELCGACARARR